jgi:dTDP-4-dehydrorhamnose reductase
MKKKIYMAGCGGMLGEAFHAIFSNNYELKCTDIEVNDTWLTKLDFRSFEDYFKEVDDFKPDYLFHIGAYTDLEYCEANQEDTYNTNTKSVENAVNISNKFDIPIIYISTAGIFDGKKDTFDESDTPGPTSCYAKSKYKGELFVQKNSKKHLICRAGWMMGGGPNKDKKFIQKIIKQIKKGEEELFIVNDKVGTPTYTYDFVNNLKLLLENNKWGLFNMVCSGFVSRFDVTKELISILNLENKIKITEVNSDYWKKEYYVSRPDSECLINGKLNKLKMNIMRDWKVCLREYINKSYKDYLK